MPHMCPPGKQWERKRKDAESTLAYGQTQARPVDIALCLAYGGDRFVPLCPAIKALPPLYLLTGEAWLQGLIWKVGQ